jgi:Cu/Ag efflux protein CusF
MTFLKAILAFALLLSPLASPRVFAESKNCGCKCCVGKEVCCCHVDDESDATPPAKAPAEAEKPAEGHPLKGVIVDIMPERNALLVKHEEIPGVMRAMTMLLTVNDAGLKAAVKDAPVTGLLVRRGTVWWLDDVAVAAKK